jgi:tRNA/tmRNA/rRNA uracil-C5-methylase (TrmA/RlmC/RlmD family)
VVGIDNVQSAIDDASANAAFNSITNTTFVCGAAEKVMNSVLQVSG